MKLGGLKIKLFGEFQVWRGGGPIESEEWGRQKTRPLLKLLLTRPGRAFSRDEISEALWPGASLEAADRSLRATVSLLRRVLEPDLKRGSDSHYILRRRPGYSFDREADCWVDAWEFEKLENRAQAAQSAGKLETAINEYRMALELSGGDLLAEDPYEDWAIEARGEWQERHLAVLSNLSECLALKGRYTEAVEVCEQALDVDGYREDLHRRIMLYHYCAGEQALALRTFRRYAGKLVELRVAPSPEMTRLKDQIEARDVPGVDELRRYPRPRRPLRFPYSLGRMHFVGREREYALLAGRLKEATEGYGSAVAVEGEAGVGKTRLMEEFLGYARSRGFRVLSGRCCERELDPPLEPVTGALGSLAAEDKAPGVVEEDFGYGHKAGTDGGARVYGSLFRELIRRSCDAEALILFVDDVQWADPATLEFLSYAAKHVSGERILLAVTYRREDAAGLSGWLDHLAERRAVTTLSLDRLLEEDVTELLRRMTSRGFEGLPALADFLYRESEGNPFYAVEYLRWLIEAGIVRVDSRRRICALEGELQNDALPSGVRDLIRARINGLDGEARDLLALAAVIGRTFDLRLLREVAAWGEAGTLGTMDLLLTSGLVVKSPEGAYYFAHDKLRQALYEGIGDFERQELHLRVAEALEEIDGEPAELAHHYLRAREWGPALENLMRAARKAQEGYAWETALNSYARALEIVDKLPDPEETRFGLLMAREQLLEYAGRWEEREATVREIFELASSLGDPGRIAEVHLRRVGVLAALSDVEGALASGWEAVTIFRELGDRAGEARAHREISYVLWINRDYAGALQANFRALWIHCELDDRRSEAGIVGNIAQVYRAMGDHEQALWWGEEAARIYRELGDRLGEAMKIDAIAAVHRDRGDLETALSLGLKALRYDAEVGAKDLLVQQHSTCGTLYLRLGDPKEALEHFRAAAGLGRELGYTREEGYSLMSVGVCLEQLGDYPGAADVYRTTIKTLQTAYEVSGMTKELSGKADVLALLASLLHRSLDEPTEALEAYESAASVYRELDDAHRLRKVLLGLTGLRWRAGNPEGAARGYEEALSLAREHGEKAHEVAALMSLSVVYRDLSRFRESVRCGRAALELLRDLEDPQAEAYVLSSLAESYVKLGHHPSALSCLKRSLRLRKRIGDEEGRVGVLQDLAEVYKSLGNSERARACAREAVSKEGAPERVLSSGRRG